MSDIALKVENLSKLYRLGEVGTGTLVHDLQRWWANIRGKEDPFSVVGQENDRAREAQKGEHVWAIKDINIEVKQGEVLGIIGKNGAGKSTLLKILSHITSPTTGSIVGKGRLAALLQVGTGMHPEMTGTENIYLMGTIMGMTRREINAKFDDIMDFAGCAKYADTPVKRYSSGMKVRLGFGIAAFLEPEILIVDEVLAVGDAEFQKKAIGKMQDVSQGAGRTVLFVSHNMNSINRLCDRAVLLENGKIAYQGETSDVVNYYLSESFEMVKYEPVIIPDQDYTYSAIFKYVKLFSVERKIETSIFDVAEQFEIRIGILLKKNFSENFKVGFTILDHNEEKVLLSYFNDHPDSENIKEAGEYELSVLIPLPLLRPGDYVVSVGMSDVSYTFKNILQKCMGFRIENISRKQQNQQSLIFKTLPWKAKSLTS